jgi:Uma2 family endonuclease
MSTERARRHFNVTQYRRMIETGILREDDRVELIEGEIVEMSPIGSQHASCVDSLNTLLVMRVGQSARVRVQNPIHLNDFSEPQPDIAVLKLRADRYRDQHPGPEDVLLVIEVADTSAQYDRNVKIPLYGRAGVSEAWLVDLQNEIIEVHTQPGSKGYHRCDKFFSGQTIKSTSVTGLEIPFDEIIG